MAIGFLGQRVNRVNLDFRSKGSKMDLTQNVSLQMVKMFALCLLMSNSITTVL